MANNSFSSPELRVIACISQCTLENYVRDFRIFFSPGAQINKKGRRFNERDIKNILLIKRMHFHHSSHDAITEALAGEKKVDPLGHEWLEIDEVTRLAIEIRESQKKLEVRLYRLEYTIRKLDEHYDLESFRIWRNLLKECRDDIKELRQVTDGWANQETNKRKKLSWFQRSWK